MSDRLAAASLTWLLLLSWVFAVLVLVFWAAGTSAGHTSVAWWVVVVAVGLVVGTGVPVLRWLRPAVETLLFSHPDDAADLIAAVGRRFVSPGTSGPEALVSEIAGQIGLRLRLPYVAIVTAGEDPPPAADGSPPAPERLTQVPLTFAGETVATLLVLPRSRDRALSRADLDLLHELAAHIGIALQAVRLSTDLRTSRTALVTAREEERRRIRRDLHDGLGPTLASLRLHLAAVQQLLPEQPDRARDLVDRLRVEVRTTSGQVRELVYGLRPAGLDEFGLIEALRSRAGEVAGVAVSVPDPGALAALPAAVEVALYRIGSEAIANVARHAGASRCVVTLAVADRSVSLQIEDDGRGLPDPLVPDVGLAGMRERAEELAGTLTLRSAGTGTTLVAVLPLALASSSSLSPAPNEAGR